MHSLLSFSTVGIAGLLMSGALGACSNGGDEGLLITKNVAVSGGGVSGCMFTGAISEPFSPHGFVDVNAEGYLLFPQFESRILFDSTDPNQMTQKTVLVTDADVDVTFPDPKLFSDAELAMLKANGLTHFKELLSVPVPPEGTADGEIEVVHHELISAVLAKQATGDVEMQVSVVAHGTLSGGSVSSQAFVYPVTLTRLAQIFTSCPAPVGTTIQTGNPCNIFQDGTVTCCTDTDGTLVCPAPLATQ